MCNNSVVHRIMALKDIVSIKTGKIIAHEGEIGGYIQCENNLSFEEKDISWVADNSIVYGKNTQVLADAIICGDSLINNGAFVKMSLISNSNICGAKIYYSSAKNSLIYGEDAQVWFSKLNGAHIKNVRILSQNINQQDKHTIVKFNGPKI